MYIVTPVDKINVYSNIMVIRWIICCDSCHVNYKQSMQNIRVFCVSLWHSALLQSILDDL